MRTHTAEWLVDAEPAEAYSAVLGVAERLWSVTGEDVVDARPGERVVHAVPLDGDTSCWLSWDLTPVGSLTLVRLAHDDADLGDGPPPDLDGVAAVLRRALDRAGRPR